MNYRPYPDAARALAQVERGRVEKTAPPSPTAVAAWRFLESLTRAASRAHVEHPRRIGKTALQRTLVDEAVKAGEHVHVAGLDGVKCAGGDDACAAPRTTPPSCEGCGHAQHPPGTECEAGVDHGPEHWHRCLCLATPGASKACPPQMTCQGGTLGHTDILHLRQGRSLCGPDGSIINPDALAERQPIVLARVQRTVTSNPAQWNAWTADGKYLYMRFRFGVGTVSAGPSFRLAPLIRFEHGGRYAGHISLTEFCKRAGLTLADDAEVIGE